MCVYRLCIVLIFVLLIKQFGRRDVADIAGLTTYAFGTEDVDRHVMVFKKEYPLTEEELDAYKCGEEWDPEKAKETAYLVSMGHKVF